MSESIAVGAVFEYVHEGTTETHDFLDIKGEVIERFHADTRMSKRDIKSWGAKQANESDVDYSDV